MNHHLTSHVQGRISGNPVFKTVLKASLAIRERLSEKHELVAATLIVVAVLYWLNMVSVNLPKYWALDFRYFWTAGRIWLDGGYIYSAAYMEIGADAFGAFTNPFYYPPALAPLTAPLAALPPLTAARVFVAINLLALLFAARLLAHMAVSIGFVRKPQTANAAFALLYLALMMPTIAIAAYGHIGILLGVSIVTFLYGWVFKKPILTAVSLTLLLVKPQIGLALIIFGLFYKDQWRAVIYALCATALLSIIGLHLNNPIAALSDYISHLAFYGERAGNAGVYSAGLGFILYMAGSGLTPLVAAATSILTPVAVAFAFKQRTTEPINQIGVILFTLTLIVFLTPNHRTDFVLLTPALLMLFAPIATKIKALLFASFVMLGQSVRLTMATETYFGFGSEALASLVSTCAMAVIIIVLAHITRQRQT